MLPLTPLAAACSVVVTRAQAVAVAKARTRLLAVAVAEAGRLWVPCQLSQARP